MPNLRGMRPAAALASIRYIGLLGALAALTLMGQRAGFADEAPPIVNEKFTNLAPAIKMLRSEIGQDRRDIVAAAMLLTPSEGKTFWPLLAVRHSGGALRFAARASLPAAAYN